MNSPSSRSPIGEPAEAASLAQRVIEAVSNPYDIDGHRWSSASSIGIAMGPSDGHNPEQLVRNADLALYRAKSDGRGTFRFFEPDDGRADAGPPCHGKRHAQGARRRRIRALLPADGQARQRRDQRVRGAHSLAPSHARDGHAGQVHAARRGDRLHHPHRGMDDPRGMRDGREMAWAIAGCRQPLARAIQKRRLAACGCRRAGRIGPGSRPAGARDQRDGAVGRRGGSARHPLSAARPRRADRDGRFRHRDIRRSTTCRASPSTRSRSTARS